jgi:hypothetical protein
MQLPIFGSGSVTIAERQRATGILPSGYKVIDAFFPLKYGHTTALSGERGVGKSQLALDVLCGMQTAARCVADAHCPAAHCTPSLPPAPHRSVCFKLPRPCRD